MIPEAPIHPKGCAAKGRGPGPKNPPMPMPMLPLSGNNRDLFLLAAELLNEPLPPTKKGQQSLICSPIGQKVTKLVMYHENGSKQRKRLKSEPELGK